MSLVMPKPAAEFSALAITQSTSWCSTSAARPLRNSSRPGRPTMSPMKSTIHPGRSPGRRTGMRCAWPRRSMPLGQHHRQFARAQRGAARGPRRSAFHANHARESPEVALHQVEGRPSRAGPAPSSRRPRHHALAEEDPQRRRGHAGRVHDQLDDFVGLEDVHEGAAGAGHGGPGRPALGEFVEKLANVVGQIAPFARLDKGKLGHRPAIIRRSESVSGLQSLVSSL